MADRKQQGSNHDDSSSNDLSRLDRITDYDEAIDALEEFLDELIEEFAAAPEGKAYLADYPEMEDAIGSWIDNLLHFGYAYLSVTLPRMTKKHVETIVTQLFPQKLSLFDPNEADTAIPELLAFWKFLQREYKLRNASKIVSFLEKIQPRFKELMNDPKNFGMAKSFFMSGTAAGFDMTTEEGLNAFQQQYNQGIKDGTIAPPSLPAMLNGMMSILSPQGTATEGTPPEGTPPEAQMEQLLNLLNQAIGNGGTPAAPEELFSPESAGLFSSEPSSFKRGLRSTMWERTAEVLPPLSDEQIQLLKQQSITATEPGTILKDFQMLLDFIGDRGATVSSTYHLFSLSLMKEINERLSYPVLLDMKRPVQKSYPYINGLYLLLRTTGLGQIGSKGKKPFLMLNSETLQSWNQLNPTEQYFSLLEAWMVRADEEILGERRTPLNEGTKCVEFWRYIPDKGQQYSKFADQERLNYWPELHNLALMHLFGFIELESGKPELGKGWRVQQIKRSPLGDALIEVLVRAAAEVEYTWESETNPSLPFGELQPAFQPYFPEWQNSLAIVQPKFRNGVYVFKVSLGKIWRRIAISSDMTLADLGGLILDSVDFDCDHLDMFQYRTPNGRLVEIQHPACESSPSTAEVCIGDLPLMEGGTMLYVFDFGDWWEFTVQLEAIQPDDQRSNYAEIVERHGKAPEQYPSWDEE